MKFLDSAPFVLARACTASDGRFDTSFDRHRPLCTLCTRIFTHRMHRIGCGADRVMRVLLVLLRLLRLPFACSLKIVHETRLFVWQLSHRLSVSLVRCATASRVFVLVYCCSRASSSSASLFVAITLVGLGIVSFWWSVYGSMATNENIYLCI